MLRSALGIADLEHQTLDADCWRVSSGTAGVLRLLDICQDAAPTTAYLLLGERCANDCAFCTQQARNSAAAANLSRVVWPEFPSDRVIEATTAAFVAGQIARACFQVTSGPRCVERTRQAVSALSSAVSMPICASIRPRTLDDVTALLAAGCERVTIALDAACEHVYRQTKGHGWKHTLALLRESARRHPGHIGTHLIVGLGETEREMVERIQEMADLGITVGLFAFTPVSGTRLAAKEPPPLAQYRRVQAALWLIVRGLASASAFTYDARGCLLSFGQDMNHLLEQLANGEAFRTAGCPGCNRPYYNERPGGVLYNYPRPLTREQAREELNALRVALQRDEL